MYIIVAATVLKVLFPMAMGATWVTPQELWELEDREVSAADLASLWRDLPAAYEKELLERDDTNEKELLEEREVVP